MEGITKELIASLDASLTKLDVGIDAYMNENPDLYAQHVWRPLWDMRKIDYRQETFAKTAWVKVCLDNLNNPAQAAYHRQYIEKLVKTIPILLQNIELLSRAPMLSKELLQLCQQVTVQLNDLARQI